MKAMAHMGAGPKAATWVVVTVVLRAAALAKAVVRVAEIALLALLWQ